MTGATAAPLEHADYAFRLTDGDGRSVELRDFASCGADGRRYWSWLNVIGAKETPFSPANPLRRAP